ncbi:MAG: cysteine desulfurase [Erysipelotrichaceae bacterium]
MFNIEEIRLDFPMLNNKRMQNHQLIYLDNAATTLKPQCVIDAVVNYYSNLGANAHRGDYELSYMVDTAFEETRKEVAKFINAKEDEICFTSGASEALNTVAVGYGQNLLKEGDIILSAESEHASSILPWMRCAKDTKAIMKYIPLDEEGRITLDNVKAMMNDKVKIVAIAQVSNVLGYVTPIKEITELVHSYGAKIVVDGAQSVPHQPIDVKDLDIDFLAFSAHKMCGPTGVGVLYGKYKLLEETQPLLLGGGSNARFEICGNIQLKKPPFKFETGTPNIEGVIGFGAAIKYLNKIGMNNIHQREKELHQYAIQQLKQLNNVHIYNEHCEAAIITFNINNIFAQDVATFFNANGLALRSGQHCAKMLIEKLETSATLRASIYFYNTKEEIDELVKLCKNATMENCLNVFF